MPREPIRIVFYAVNGTGVGHLTRLLAIARWLRRYGEALGARLEVWFLTSSEAEALAFAEGFPAFKMPSKTVIAQAGMDRRGYATLAKQWIWHTLGLLRPDVLVVDTFPRGSFGELLSALDLARKAAFVYRPVRREVAERPDFQAMLRLYDLVLVPERGADLGDMRADDGRDVLVPDDVRDRVVFVGPVLLRERFEMRSRAAARAALEVPDGARCVFVSAGGGGDPGAQAHIARVVSALAAVPSTRVVVGQGPLSRGPRLAGVATLTGVAAEWSLAFDAAITAAGYNTFGELMFAGVPCLFLPQEKLADDQRARAQRAVDAGAARILEGDDDIAAALDELMARPDASARARSLVPENGARLAAAEILRLVVPSASVDAVEAAVDEQLETRPVERG